MGGLQEVCNGVWRSGSWSLEEGGWSRGNGLWVVWRTFVVVFGGPGGGLWVVLRHCCVVGLGLVCSVGGLSGRWSVGGLVLFVFVRLVLVL